MDLRCLKGICGVCVRGGCAKLDEGVGRLVKIDAYVSGVRI